MAHKQASPPNPTIPTAFPYQHHKVGLFNPNLSISKFGTFLFLFSCLMVYGVCCYKYGGCVKRGLKSYICMIKIERKHYTRNMFNEMPK